MQAWLESVVGPQYAPALMWTIAALILLLVLLIIIRVVRGLTFGTFVSGGRNRKTRLAVMDATAVDSHRRLVLVRRDDVEHLILIGGPSDVVVEQNIRVMASARMAPSDPHPEPPTAVYPQQPEPPRAPVERPAAALPAAAPRAPQPVAPQPLRPAPSVPPAAPQPRFTAPPISPPPPPRPAAPVAAAPAVPPTLPPRPAVMQPVVAPPPPPPVQPPAPAAPGGRDDLDDALLKELEMTLENDQARPQAPSGETSTDKAVSRFMSDLTAKR